MTAVELVTTEHELEREGCHLHATVIDGPGVPVIATSGALGLRTHSLAALAGVVGTRKLILLEVRGHGSSVCRHLEHYSWPALTADLAVWCEHLQVERCSLLGSSLGSIVSLGLAVSGKVQVDSMVLANAVFLGADADIDPSQALALQALAAAFGTAESPTAESVAGSLDQLVPGSRDLYLQALSGHADLGSVASYFRATDRGPLPYTTGQLRSLRVPTLIISGSDAIHPPHVSQALAQLMPHADLLELDVTDPDLTQRALSDFLTGDHQ